jgi:hypothetical protein
VRAAPAGRYDGCLLLAESSCEQRNDFLERALVVPTVDSDGATFFEDA